MTMMDGTTMGGRKTMTTDFAKLSIAAFAIFMIPVLLASGAYLQELSDYKKYELIQLYAKRDDLITQQQKLETLIQSLNQTLAYEVARQQELSAQLTSLSAEKAAMAVAQAQAAQVAQAAASAPPPQPIYVPAPAPVTRAS